MVAEKASEKNAVEARIARLESDVGHLRTDVADIKVDLRALRDKMDNSFERLDSKIDSKSNWALGLYLALAVGMFGAMARGFGWL
jgi:predicted  nucleic acid-binding Zn-ribbon protein